MPRKHVGHASADGVARLVEAEREWERLLDAARVAATVEIQASRTEAARIEAAAEAEIARVVEARRRELEASTAMAVRRLDAELTANISRYSQLSASTVDAIARSVADAAPWFSRSENAEATS